MNDFAMYLVLMGCALVTGFLLGLRVAEEKQLDRETKKQPEDKNL